MFLREALSCVSVSIFFFAFGFRIFFAILIPYAGCGAVTDSIILLNSDSTFDLKSDSI